MLSSDVPCRYEVTFKGCSGLLTHMREFSDVIKGALRTRSAQQAPLWGSLLTCVVYCLRVRQC